MNRTPSIRPVTYAALISIPLAGAGIVWLWETVIAEGGKLSAAEDIFLDLLIGIVILFALGWPLLWRQSRDRERYHREIEEEKNKLDTAVRHMSQGLVMFDAAHRVVLCNPRYLELHGVSPAIVKPGLSFRDLLIHRKEIGSYLGDVDELCDTISMSLAEGKTMSLVAETSRDHFVQIVNVPMVGGGWVAMHEDVTERQQLLKARDRAEEAEREQKLQLDTALKNMVHGLCMFDGEGRIILFNRRYPEMMGLSAQYLRGRSLLDVFKHRKSNGDFTGDPAMELARIVHDVRQGKFTVNERTRADGMTLRVMDQPVDGGGWIATFEDVTEQRRAEHERDRGRSFLDMIIDNVPSAIFVKNAVDRKYVRTNQAGERLWGIPRQAVIGNTAAAVFPDAEAAGIKIRDDELLHSGRALFDEREIQTPGRGMRSILSRRLIIRDECGEAQFILGVVDDVTERKAAEARIAHLAHYDSLTNLPNRTLFREQLEKELSFVRRGGQLAVFYIDLDHFKGINDTLGHPVGDDLLKEVAVRLSGCLREADLIARLGGDEFAIVQTKIGNAKETEIFALRLREVIAGTPYDLNGHLTTTDLSIGIALAPGDGTEIDDLVKHADLALYGAKAEGRGNYRYYDPEMNARMKRRRALEIDLRSALANDEFVLHYQPLIKLQTGEITGCEALLRWRHPELGMIPPIDFVSVAEETGLINAVGNWVLRQACIEAMTWPSHVSVAVNVSPVQFRNPALPLSIVAGLEESGLPARRLELEITESVLMQNNAATLAALHHFHDLGVRISMDDFGTGYSSLSYLRSFPFDKIKIDRSFIEDLAKGAEAVAIVQAILDLASALHMKTTAEGVETNEQKELLEAIGCNEVQGFLFSHPLPASGIAKLFNLKERPIKAA